MHTICPVPGNSKNHGQTHHTQYDAWQLLKLWKRTLTVQRTYPIPNTARQTCAGIHIKPNTWQLSQCRHAHTRTVPNTWQLSHCVHTTSPLRRNIHAVNVDIVNGQWNENNKQETLKNDKYLCCSFMKKKKTNNKKSFPSFNSIHWTCHYKSVSLKYVRAEGIAKRGNSWSLFFFFFLQASVICSLLILW